MSLTLKWHGKEAADVVGRTRAYCYAPVTQEVEAYQKRLAEDGRVTGDDLLFAERDGVAVGTATSYSMTMWVRGRAVPCQGVAWVGTVKTHRRSGGVASAIMNETIRKGRERGQVVSALMPFRASFYEHFGYGLMERRTTWTIPLSVLSGSKAMGPFELVSGVDEARRGCRERMVRGGQCEIERTPGSWDHWGKQEGEAYVVADRAEGETRSWWVWTQQKHANGRDVLNVYDQAWDSAESLRRALAFFGTLRDQYWGVTLTLPADLPVNRWLRESQVPHRPVNHETAECKTFTRMAVRVLDHVRLLEGMAVPGHLRGAVTVAIAETEGTVTTLRLKFDGGQVTASPSSDAADVEMSDRDWAAVVLGDLSASRAAEMRLTRVHSAGAVELLDGFAAGGPAPFCNEYF